MTTSPSKLCERCGNELPPHSHVLRIYCGPCRKHLDRERSRQSHQKAYNEAVILGIPFCKACYKPIKNPRPGQERHDTARCSGDVYDSHVDESAERVRAEVSETSRLLNYKPAQRVTGQQHFFGGGKR